MAETLSAKEAARELSTDARTFRKFMRSITPKEDQPGQGNRYQIEPKRIPKLKKQFEDWNKPKPKPDPDIEDLTDEELEESMISEDEDIFADEVDIDEEEVPDFSDTDDEDEEPSDDELAEIEASDLNLEEL